MEKRELQAKKIKQLLALCRRRRGKIKVCAALFFDGAFLKRKTPERVLGLQVKDGKAKWARPIRSGTRVESAAAYRKLCQIPTMKAKRRRALLRWAKAILPTRGKEDLLPGHQVKIQKIIKEEKLRAELEQRGNLVCADFSFFFGLLDEEMKRIRAGLIKRKGKKGIDREEEALEAFFSTYPWRIRHKGGILGLTGPCPACGRKDKAYLIKTSSGRWYIKCHRASCGLDQSLLSFCVQEG